MFVSKLAKEKLTYGTIKCYLAGVRHAHIAGGFGDPRMSEMPRLEQVIRGIKAVQCKGGEVPSRTGRLPITPRLLKLMKQSWQASGNGQDQAMLWAASTLCFFGFMRSGEITVPNNSTFDEGAHLMFRDITVDSTQNPQVLKVRLKASKTDPFRTGINIFVGRTDNELCPVSAVLAYMTRRGAGSGPLFQFQDGTPLTQTRFVVEIRKALAAAGVDCRPYSGHSFRIGAATTAAERGVGDTTIKTLGRWKSSAYQAYVRLQRSHLAEISRCLAAN